MGFNDGQLLLDRDDGVYCAGQTVYGRIVFDQGIPETIHGIYVSFKGFCKVHWTSTETHKENERDVTETINHDSYEEYFNRKIYVMGGPRDDYHLHPGHHEFKFDFPLPINIPSSFEEEKGHIRYRVKAVMVTSGITNKEKMVSLRVFTPVDLNQNSFCTEPLEIEMVNSYCCCCFEFGSAEVKVKMPVGGYCPGQTIPVEVNVSNLGRVDIDKLKLTIKRETRFEATQNPGVRTDTYTVAQIVKGPVAAGTTPSWNLEIPIQAMDVYNFDTCHFINVNYTFTVATEVGACHENNEESHPIVFGTVPLAGYQDTVQIPQPDQTPKNIPGQNVPSLVVVNQPRPTTVSQNQSYPQNNPYPYPGIQPYPNPGIQPYPNQGNQPFPNLGNQPYPNVSMYPTANPGSPYPNSPGFMVPSDQVPLLPTHANFSGPSAPQM